MMNLAAFIALDTVQALVFHWPLWLALILAQAVVLWLGIEDRWLPSALLGIGLVWAFLRPFWHGGF